MSFAVQMLASSYMSSVGAMSSPRTHSRTGSASGSSKSTDATVAASTIVALISQPAHDVDRFRRRFPSELLRALPQLGQREPAPVDRRSAGLAFDHIQRPFRLGS